MIISIKYLLLVMRADNHGEGGILALTALLMPTRGLPVGTKRVIIALGVFGTALLYGDGLITPAISVLSAVEGFEVATTAFESWVIPVSVAILIALFVVQKRGTEKISRVFGPVMVVWFVVLGVLGLRQIIDNAGVLRAVSPTYGVDLFVNEPAKAFLALGSIFLVVTGGEALYADMGHFGRRPIQVSWYALVLPALLLNYFGQAALLADSPGDEVGNPFFRMAPSWAVVPLAVLATMATVIASQALISGAFSLTSQAVQLDYLPRLAIRHTSSAHIGQIYVPLVNWVLMIGCVGLVVGFRTSSNLAAAYGIAVTATMAITTLIFYRVVRDRWDWGRRKAMAVIVPLFLVDLAFFAANVPKIPDGGWLPLLIGLGLVIQMTTWRRGRAIVAQVLQRGQRRTEAGRGGSGRRRGGDRAGNGDLHVQGSGLRAAGDDLEPSPQPRAPRDDGDPVGDHDTGAARRRRTGLRRHRCYRACIGWFSPLATWTTLTWWPSCSGSVSTAPRSTLPRSRSSSDARPCHRSPKGRCRDGAKSSSSC